LTIQIFRALVTIGKCWDAEPFEELDVAPSIHTTLITTVSIGTEVRLALRGITARGGVIDNREAIPLTPGDVTNLILVALAIAADSIRAATG